MAYPSKDQNSKAIVFIDANISNYQEIIKGINDNTQIIILNSNHNGIEQITNALQNQKFSAIHIISHGQTGSLQIGNTQLNLETLPDNQYLIQQWHKSLTPDADILLYGCNLAETKSGKQLLQQLSNLTGADIAASTNLTGNTALSGDWQLEYNIGKITANIPFSPENLKNYPGILDATYHNLSASNFSQNWGNTSLITVNDNWNNVPSIIGYRGDGLASTPGTDPQTILADGTATPINVNANQNNPNTFTTGGVTEFDGISNPTIALNGSATAQASHLLLHLNTTGQQNIRVNYTLRDLDNSSNNSIQPIAVQYRIGNSGNFINIPEGFVADASHPVAISTREAKVGVLLPIAANNQSQVQIRIITTDAVGFDEWIGIDSIQVTSSAIAANQIPVANNDTYTLNENSSLTTAPAITSLELDADPDNYIGQGDYYSYAHYRGNFTANKNFKNGVSLNFSEPGIGGDWWYPDFSAANNVPLTPGTYLNATRYPFNAITEPGLGVGGNGRGYNTLTGEFTIHEIVYGTGSQIIKFDASFRENGDADPPSESFRGRIRYRATGNSLLPGVLANDTDVESPILTANLVTLPAYGSVILNADGSFTYTPNPGFSGVDTFTYRANDSYANSTPATVTLNVLGINDPPVNSLPATVTTNEDTSLAFTGSNLISISDPDAATSTISSILNIPTGKGVLNITPQTGLTITGNNSNNIQLEGEISAINAGLATLNYTPAADINGTVNLTVTTNDLGNTGTGGAKTDTDTVAININAVNDAPSFIVGNNQTVNAGAGMQTVTGWATGFVAGPADESGQSIDSYLINVISNPGILTGAIAIDPVTGHLTYTPVATIATATTATIEVRVKDNGGIANGGQDTSPSQTFTITVNPVSSPSPSPSPLPSPLPSPSPFYNNGSIGNTFITPVTPPTWDCICEKITMPKLPQFLPNFTTKIIIDNEVNNSIKGSKDSEEIRGLQGNDEIIGNEGDDIIFGGIGSLWPVGAGIDRDTIYGNTGNDYLHGGEGEDLIFAGQNNDIVHGGKDNDFIYGDRGNDTLSGDLGNDTIYGGVSNAAIGDIFGQDLIYGGAGDDLANGNENNDTISGGDGNDTLHGGKNDDQILGDAGNDLILGEMGNDSLCGGEGNDTIYGGNGSLNAIGNTGEKDEICGGIGDDLIYGNEGQDTICGGQGNDTIYGGKDKDIINGEAGNDFLSGDLGNDTLIGGSGEDKFMLKLGFGSDIIFDFIAGEDKLVFSNNLSFNQLTFSQDNNSTLIKFANNNEILAVLLGVNANNLKPSDFILI